MPKKSIEDITTQESHKGNGFKEPQSKVFTATDQAKVNAMDFVGKPKGLTSRVEVADWFAIEAVPYAMMMVQSEFIDDPTIDPIFSFVHWMSAFRRGVDGALVEKMIQLNRSQMNPLGMNGMGQNLGDQGVQF